MGNAVLALRSYASEKRPGAASGLHLPGCTARDRREGPGPSPNANEPRGPGWRLRGGVLVAHFPSRGEGGARRSGRGRCFFSLGVVAVFAGAVATRGAEAVGGSGAQLWLAAEVR